MDLKEVLVELGYSNITDNGKEYRMRPIYRESNNSTSLCVKKDTGRFFDFSAGITGKFEELVKISLNLSSVEEAQKHLENKDFSTKDLVHKPKIKQPKKLDQSTLSEIEPNHEYWINRGISEETLKVFNGGVVKSGRMKNRYVFPVFNCKEQLVGLSGRSLNADPKIKWKHWGTKDEWKYPAYFNIQHLKNAESCYLVESIGDMLKLWEAGYKSSLVLFGLKLSTSVLNVLIKCNPKKVLICTNNDSHKDVNSGSEAASKIQNKLLKFFDKKRVEIKLPPKNDFGEMTVSEIQSFYNVG